MERQPDTASAPATQEQVVRVEQRVIAVVNQKFETVNQKFETVDEKFETVREETRAMVSEGVNSIKDRMLTFVLALNLLALIGVVVAINRLA